MGMLNTLRDWLRMRPRPTAAEQRKDLLSPGERADGARPKGQTATPEAALEYLYRRMWTDPRTAQAIYDIRTMDREDGRVKKIHKRTSAAAAKGGLVLKAPGAKAALLRHWDDYVRRLHLDRREKLESDLRGLMMEGNLPMEWILDGDLLLQGCARLPAETILPKVGPNGSFEDPARAYEQIDWSRGQQVIASFALFQLTLGRMQPDNYDDWGSMGRPYLDATRGVWKKLTMTEEDLVVRRRTRAPLRMAHVLEGAGEDELKLYRTQVEQDQAHGNWADYYLNKKGAVTAVQGDANLDQIADVAHLLDTFFSGAPAPKGLFGYVSDLSRDILEDLKQDFFDEIDSLQDTASFVYDVGFRLHLLLQGLNPNAYDFDVQFRERRTETVNQKADLALKYQALGMPRDVVWQATGLDVNDLHKAARREAEEGDPYGDGLGHSGRDDDEDDDAPPVVKITPGNARKGGSATTISTRGE